MDGVRVGNKKPTLKLNLSYATGKTNDNCSPHTAGANKTVSGGTPVHGKPLMSDAAKKGK